MKRSTLKSMFRTVAIAGVLFVPLGTTLAFAQEAGPAEQQTAVRSTLTAQQLDNLVAPLALYPDPLLSQVLVARLILSKSWKRISGCSRTAASRDGTLDAATQQNWDPSVQALVAFPDVMTRLTQDVRWTTDLGNAFLGQQADVMAPFSACACAPRPRQAAEHSAGNGHHADPERPAGHYHSAGRSAGNLRPDL